MIWAFNKSIEYQILVHHHQTKCSIHVHETVTRMFTYEPNHICFLHFIIGSFDLFFNAGNTDFKKFVHGPVSAGKNYQRLCQVEKPELAYKKVVEFKCELLALVWIRVLRHGQSIGRAAP